MKQSFNHEEDIFILESLNRAGKKIISSLSKETILTKFYDFVSLLLIDEIDFIGIAYYDENSNEINFQEINIETNQISDKSCKLIEFDTLSDYSLNNQKKLIINDFETQNNQYFKQNKNLKKIFPASESLIYYPLIFEDNLRNIKNKIGVLTIQASSKNAYTNESVNFNLLENLVMYLSIALENAINYEKIQELNNRLTSVNALLNQQKEEIITQNEHLSQQTDEISLQNDKLSQNNIEIERQREKLQLQNEEIISSIKYAERIQDAVLPSKEFVDKILNDYFILFMPCYIVSGDFYWIKQIKNYTIVATADCTGHGVPGAFMSMLGTSFLNEIMSTRQIESAGEILNRLRDKVKKSLHQEGMTGEQKDGLDIAFYIINNDTLELQFSGAYNPLYIIRNKTNAKPEFIHLKADRQPIAIHVNEKEFTTQKFQLKKNDCLYTFSDGYSDQFGGDKEKKYKSKNFKNLLLQIHNRPMKEQKDILQKNFTDWCKNIEQIDDVIVIGVRV